jgi:pilus assembly protein CpaB
VKPNDAERVVLASAQGSVHCVLRNGSDHATVEDRPADISELGGGPKPAVAHVKAKKVDAPPSTAKVYTVETVAGGKQTTESFQ